MVFKVCTKFLENMSRGFKVKGNNFKSRKTRVIVHAPPHMVFKVCTKFHENMSRVFKVMERTRKLLTHKGQ